GRHPRPRRKRGLAGGRHRCGQQHLIQLVRGSESARGCAVKPQLNAGQSPAAASRVPPTKCRPSKAGLNREELMTTPTKDKTATRRRFLKAAAAGAATAVAAPTIASAQGPISMRWQSTWPSKDIFHEYALDYAKKVNDMTGGDLKIEVLPAGAVVPAFGLL